MARTDKPAAVRMKLIGVGDGGGHMLDYIVRGERLPGVEAVALNTDAMALERTGAGERVQLGRNLTRGLGTGGDGDLGRRAALQDLEQVERVLEGAALVFLMVGLGGGTGGGAAPEIARVAREHGALVLGFVTLPFSFEGDRRRQQAAAQLELLRQQCDAVVTVPNDKLFRMVGEDATAVEAFRKCDELMAIGARAVWQLLARPGLIHLDFATLRSALGGRHGEGVVGFGEAGGVERVREAVEQMLASPLLEGGQILGRSERVLVSVCAGPDLTLGEVQKCAAHIKRVAPRAQIELGAAVDENCGSKLSVTVVASVVSMARKPTPVPVPVATVGSKQPAAGVAGDEPSTGSGGAAVVSRPSTAKRQVKQGELPLEKGSTGRFENGEPTLWEGENLDVPTYVRRGVSLTG